MSICVLGSLNMDLVIHTPHFPAPGETIAGSSFQQIPGGKGANQALAAARLGASVQMVGRVGADAWGEALCRNLAAGGVNTDGVQVDPQNHTGLAFITVAQSGTHAAENQIILAPGANAAVNHQDRAILRSLLSHAQILLLQLEIPIDEVLEAAQEARKQGITVILDPAPAPLVFASDFFAVAQIITPNQQEASQLLGFPVETIEDAKKAIELFCDRGVAIPLITLGHQGVVCYNPDQQSIQHYPAFTVPVVDTTAAGDAFNGALAVALLEAKPLEQAIQWGMAAAALAVQQSGAQTSLPHRGAFDTFLALHTALPGATI